MKVNQIAVTIVASMSLFSTVGYAQLLLGARPTTSILPAATATPLIPITMPAASADKGKSFRLELKPVTTVKYASTTKLDAGKVEQQPDIRAPSGESDWQVEVEELDSPVVPEERKFENYTPWQITTDASIDLEDFRGHTVNGKRVFDKVKPTVRAYISNPNSKWRYDLKYSLAARNLPRSFKTVENTFFRNRFQAGATRNVYQDPKTRIDINLTYRKESNDVKPGSPARNSYNAFWVMPSGEYKFDDKLSFQFWDALYYYNNTLAANNKEWESEHGLQYRVNDDFTARVMFYTDWTWDNGGKLWRQQQIRGYFPTKLNEQWSVQPYFRYFLADKTFNNDVVDNRVTQNNDNGLRLGTVVNYTLRPETILWMNLAFERTKWEYPMQYGLTRDDDNKQNFGLYSFGIRHTW